MSKIKKRPFWPNKKAPPNPKTEVELWLESLPAEQEAFFRAYLDIEKRERFAFWKAQVDAMFSPKKGWMADGIKPLFPR